VVLEPAVVWALVDLVAMDSLAVEQLALEAWVGACRIPVGSPAQVAFKGPVDFLVLDVLAVRIFQARSLALVDYQTVSAVVVRADSLVPVVLVEVLRVRRA
jgi:hypothetical protein